MTVKPGTLDQETKELSPFESLHTLNPQYPRPTIVDFLQIKENSKLLDYVVEDAFGSHVFPGNVDDYPIERFLNDMNTQLAEPNPIHLWTYFPLCSKKCNFCQYPIVAVGSSEQRVNSLSKKWIDALIEEMRLWLEAVPNLRGAPVGEFNFFGGTPSLIPNHEIERVMDYLYANFNFTKDSTLRIEGNADSFSKESLEFLQKMGFNKVSIGIQSFDDEVLKLSNVSHTRAQAIDFIKMAQDMGFDRVNGDLIYGMLNQTVASVEEDIRTVLDLELTSVDWSKLHLKDYKETRTSIAGNHPAVWQKESWRTNLSGRGYHFPTIGEQYQMRELFSKALTSADYLEHPTMYFSKKGLGPERWKSIMVDQDKQCIEVAIGLGGSSSCRNSEAHISVDTKTYFDTIKAGEIPLDSAKGFSEHGKVIRAIRMALSSCQPLIDSLHQSRFPGSSLFDEYWLPKFMGLQERGLVTIDDELRKIELTYDGQTIVEAIMHTEIN